MPRKNSFLLQSASGRQSFRTRESAAFFESAKLFGFAVLLFLVGTLPAMAQYSDPTSYSNSNSNSTASQMAPSSTATDCANPVNAASPMCNGAASAFGASQQNGAASPTYGYNSPGGVQGLSGPGNALPMPGLNAASPTYNDRNPYVRSSYGTQHNPYSLYFPKYPPTAFQKIVAGAVGRMLPIYGASLFADVPATFAPVDRIPVTPDYVLGPGDEVTIRVWGQVSFNVRATIDRIGDIYIPQVGNVHIAGLQFSQLDSYLRSQLGHYFRNFDVNSNMGELRSIQIFVVGQAQRPGSYTVSSLSSLVNALFASGGPSAYGSMRNIQVKRGATVVTSFDLYDLILHGDKSKDVPLQSGDVIFIPPVGPQVAVAGSVEVPAVYELKGTETAADVIQLAGGFSTLAARQTAQMDRISRQGDRETVDLSLDAAGLATPMRDGDILHILAMVPRFDKTVTLRGNVANPGRFAWHPGMRIRDLIPDKDSLVTRDYWQRRIALGLPAPAYTPLFSAYPPPVAPATTPNASTNPAVPAEGQSANGGFDTQGNPVDASGAAVAGAAQTTASGQPTATTIPPSYQIGSVSLGSTEAAPGNLTSLSQRFVAGDRFSEGRFPVRNEIVRTAPDIDWQYAVIERTDPKTLTTSLIPFDLGQAVLDDNPSQNLALQSGDVVTVFSTADIRVPQMQRTKYIRLEGEFVHAGIYSAYPGETLRQLVARVGGLTPLAYLYGSELLRESTRRIQQARLEEYVTQVEHDVQEASANATNTVVNAIGASALTTSLQSQQNLVATLRKMHASGRVILDLNPYSSGIQALPDLPLEDGDRFIVPSLSSTVNVVGSVYDPSSFMYDRGERVEDYLKKSGGATRNGDKGREFVVRADGSVLSKQYVHGTLFGGGFDRKYIYPGDTVVVPDNVSKTTVLRALTDWAQVLTGFGLGIAALSLLGL